LRLINRRADRKEKRMATDTHQQAPAVSVALAHVEAWSNRDYEAARAALAPEVKVTVTSTVEGLPKTDTVGVDDYMTGLIAFADAVVPGSVRIDGSIGDERNALLLVTVKTAGPPTGSTTVPAAHLYLLDEENKIKSEQVVFYLVPD
jgi:SnoaL-like domain